MLSLSLSLFFFLSLFKYFISFCLSSSYACVCVLAQKIVAVEA